MDIEAGEYFAVTRGFEYHPTSSLFAPMFGTPPPIDDKPRYDRSYEGKVFRADEVCHPMVAAILVYSPDKSSYGIKVGETISLNLLEIEIMTLTKSYIDKLGIIEQLSSLKNQCGKMSKS